MPKFESKIVRQEEMVNGKTVSGITAWLPLDDAAKCSEVTQKAIDYKMYVPSSPNEKKILNKKMNEVMVKDQIKKGKMTPEDAKQFLANAGE